MKFFSTLKVFIPLLVFLVLPTRVSAFNVRVPILMYHYIGYNPNPKDTARDTLSVNPDKFEQQLTYLSQKGYTPITLNTLYGIFNNQTTPPPKPIVLTFDDGYMDFYTTAYPILHKYGFHAISFIPTGLMNQGYYMSWSQIKEIAQSGLVDFEAHSVTHANLTSLNPKRLTQELRDSKYILQTQTGKTVNFVAYPFGSSSNLVQTTAKSLGYVGGLGTWYGKDSGPSMNMPRIRIGGQISIGDFASKIR